MTAREPRKGDRVRVTYEGVYRDRATHGGHMVLRDGSGISWYENVSAAIEVLTPAEPTDPAVRVREAHASTVTCTRALVNGTWVCQHGDPKVWADLIDPEVIEPDGATS